MSPRYATLADGATHSISLWREKLLMLVAILLVALLAGCTRAEPKFYSGDMVRSVVGHHLGQIVFVGCNEYNCYYNVRFNAPQSTTDTRLLGSDEPIQSAPLAYVRNMLDFELEPVK